MTDEELRALARRSRGNPSFEDGANAMAVLIDALVERGEIAGAERMSRTELHLAAADWAWRNSDRGSGRTTRLLQKALRATEQGRRVLVLAANERHADLIRGMLPGLSTDAGAILRVHVATPDRVDRGLAPFDHVFEDHYTTEQRLARRMSPSISHSGGDQ